MSMYTDYKNRLVSIPTFSDPGCPSGQIPTGTAIENDTKGKLLRASEKSHYERIIGPRRTFDPDKSMARGSLLRLGVASDAIQCSASESVEPIAIDVFASGGIRYYYGLYGGSAFEAQELKTLYIYPWTRYPNSVLLQLVEGRLSSFSQEQLDALVRAFPWILHRDPAPSEFNTRELKNSWYIGGWGRVVYYKLPWHDLMIYTVADYL